jgi:hypothetical protein
MKKTGWCLAIVASLGILSCAKKEEKVIENTETKTIETVETVKTVEVPDTTKAADGTAVKISGDGISVDSKDVDIEIKK